MTRLTVLSGSSPQGPERLAVQQNFLHRPWLFRCDEPSSGRGRCRSRLYAANLYELNKIVNHVLGIEKRQTDEFGEAKYGMAGKGPAKSDTRRPLAIVREEFRVSLEAIKSFADSSGQGHFTPFIR